MQYSVYDTQSSFDETGKEEILMKTSKQKLQIAFCRSGQSVWIRFPLIGLKIDVGNHFESGFSPFYAHWYTNKISILRNQNHTPIDMYEKKKLKSNSISNSLTPWTWSARRQRYQIMNNVQFWMRWKAIALNDRVASLSRTHGRR